MSEEKEEKRIERRKQASFSQLTISNFPNQSISQQMKLKQINQSISHQSNQSHTNEWVNEKWVSEIDQSINDSNSFIHHKHQSINQSKKEGWWCNQQSINHKSKSIEIGLVHSLIGWWLK